MDDYIGRRVKLTTETKTQGGKTYEAGTAMYVKGHHRGRLTLTFGNKIVLRQMPRGSVYLDD